jgi:dipeptidyl aminopeptidase/acylaminoacyl peptidase
LIISLTERGLEELSAPLEVFERISPVYYLQNVQAAVSIHHGEDDLDVPLAWSIELCQQLSDLEKPIECYTYPDQPHTFHGDGNELFVQRMIKFLDQELRDR